MKDPKPGAVAAPDPEAEEDLKAKLVLETARVPWTDLQKFFARGQLARVGPGQDLIDVAVAVARDDKTRVQAWMAQRQFGEVTADQAQAWYETNASLWTVVVAPWVLVQETPEQPGRSMH